MKLQYLSPCKTAVASMKMGFHSGQGFNGSQGLCRAELRDKEFIAKLLDVKWSLVTPDSKIHQIMLSVKDGQSINGPVRNISFLNNTNPQLGDKMEDKEDLSFYIVRDDLLHPLVNGNKARKLDGLLPLLQDHSVTDVVTCGGCQSAHAAAVAVSCAERGLASHLLLRGEQPEILTGYNLISTLYGNVTYVPRSLYGHREKMLKSHANLLVGDSGIVMCCDDIIQALSMAQTSSAANFAPMDTHRSAEDYPRKVVIVSEGAGDAIALLGVIRLVNYLVQNHLLGIERPVKFIVDAGTGTTAVGLGLGALLLGLPWEVTAVILADTIDGYRQHEKRLISDFKRRFCNHFTDVNLNEVDGGIVNWVERQRPRKFGNVLDGEVETCQRIAQQTGILVDPVYTLAGWEMATMLSEKAVKGDAKVVMLHTGGTLGMFGLAQRYKSHFSSLRY
ncbi:hypothetical protein HS088_TW22G00388 [Tripterygium wilfordii]|uniref:D-cysteine desulfhydrase n=1 Tax=Tripterygium wilfordii TaxID=458696 RepID=A0A7J7BYK9_TRIWF|nr:D-cysteine desulfhydrase 2, mitochondrial [Tripterygium wilfordii]KAF5726707.1 hypothetical protein HS088_TW22G00388 [Tripterygium wilfordii]